MSGQLKSFRSIFDHKVADSRIHPRLTLCFQTGYSARLNRCEYLEERFEDKHTIYDFLTIAYDENNYALGSLWQDCVQYEAERIEPPILKLLRSFECEFENALQPLETSYKKCDILYSYCRKFGHTKYLVQISEKRNKISKRIMDLLKKKQLPIRTCSNCGKRLPLFHGYGMCDECYNDMRTNRRWYGSWYDDDDDEYDDDSDDDEYDDYEDDEDCDDFEDDDYEDDDYEVY